ncbi:FliM/FliN family flagellar motor C-terminal domain-containing protein [Vibrio metschnikovii]|uniref:FliM/FliN family flagellar motor C-terminal domain-containing protein n=1 Tax=Vibrio metschnikovii TaxID=28172 RepID=UPI001C3018A1|nr:FliM/FliN family flagellar motor C-terminal domain-containing protein [Vibrio metschnikovii]
MEIKSKNQNIDSQSQVSIAHFSKVEVVLDVKIGGVRTDIGSLMNVKAGDMLKSDVKLNDKVQLILDGNTVAEGILVEEDGCFCFQVTSIN